MYGFGMNKSEWLERAIDDCLDTSFAGEWGAEPLPSNAIVLRATDIDDDGHVIGQGAPRSIPKSKLRAKRLLHGDILLEGSGGGPDKPVGRVALFIGNAHTSPAVCSNFFKTLRPASHFVDGRFLCRKLGWFYRQPALLALQQQTTGIINLKYSEYLRTRIELPRDITEQAMIAEVLDTLDTAIRQTEAIIEKLKLVKQGLLHDLLTRGIDDNGELRPPQSEAPHLYKASALGWIPMAWNAVPFSRLADFVNGNSFDVRGWTDQGLPIIRIQNLNGSTDFNFYCGSVNYKWHVFPGDLLFAWSGQRGVSFGPRIWQGPEGVLNQHIFKVAERAGVISKRYLFEALRFRQGAIEDSAHGFKDSFLHVTRGELGAVVAGVPDADEQQAIVNRIEAFEGRVAVEQAGLSKLCAIRVGLMDDLLTGRVRVTALLEQATIP